jgi:hypothetical protein
LLASFRPDPNQNPQLQPQNYNPQQFNQGYQLQYQNYPTNQLNPNPQFIPVQQQPQNVQYSQLGPQRISQHVSQNQQQIPVARANSPPIVISFNDQARGHPLQQGSIVKQVYKPINQQQPVQY